MEYEKIINGIDRNIAALEKRIHTCGDKSGAYQRMIDKLNEKKQELKGE